VRGAVEAPRRVSRFFCRAAARASFVKHSMKQSMKQRMNSTRLTTLVVAASAALTISTAARAQSTDSVFARAKQLVVNGNGAAGRLLVDSVVAATPAGTSSYAEALYWRAALAASSTDAERDYRRIVVEYPASPRSGDALLALAQLEVARGDRAAASEHLDTFLAENPASPERPRVSLQLVRLWFDQNDLAHGCATLKTALANIPENEVEARNQLAYYSPRCAAADVGPGGRMPVPGQHMSASDSAKGDTAGKRASSSKEEAKFTLQVAAYKSKADANALAKRLKARDIDARVVGTSKLYRVRIGRYATRAAATKAQKELKARKITAFITDIGADDK
jgi:cell division septation protein DedD